MTAASWAGPGCLRFPVSGPSAEGTPDTAAQTVAGPAR